MATWVPPEQQDLKWKIWNLKFHVKVPNLPTRSRDHIKAFGTPTSGDPVQDRAAANELLDTYLSIDKMVLYHHQGVLVSLCKVTDALVIYELVVEYLSAWKHFLTTTMLQNPEVPYEDLVAMNNFIQVIYPHAQPQLTTAESESYLSKTINRLGKGLTFRTPTPVELTIDHGYASTAAPKQPDATVAEKMFSNRRRF